MKKIFALLCAGFLGLTTLQAEVLFECNFNDSTTGRLSAGAWNSGTLASDNKWYTNGNPSTFHQVVEQQLTYTDYHSTATGKAVEVKKSEQKDYILFPSAKQHASISTGEKYYMSFLYKPTELNTSDNAKNGTNTYIAGLLTSASGAGIAYTNAQVMVTTIDANTFKFGIRKITETAQYVKDGDNDKAFNINDTYLVVAEYIVNSGTADDVVNLYINPTKDSQTVSATNNLSGAPTDKTGIVGVGILAIGNAPNAALIDEIKVTTSWDDLWESGGASTDPAPTPVPSITTAGDLNFGNVNVNEEVSKAITVKGANLKGAIYINCTDPAITISAPYVSKEYAEMESGYELTVSLTATAAGDGSATITFSSEDATEESITATWSAVAPPDSVENIAELKGTVYEPYVIKTQPIVVGFIKGTPIIQDESGALPITDMWEIYSGYSALKVGDKLQNIFAYMMDDEGKIDIFPAADLAGAPNLLSSDNEVIPLVGDPSNIASYGPAYIQLTEVQFPSDKDKFETGYLDVTQGSETVKLYILDGELIDTALPAKADVKGLVSYKSFNGKVLEVSKLSEITNREEKISTAIDNINSSSLQGGERGRLFLHNGQIIILRDNKTFNLLGTEIK